MLLEALPAHKSLAGQPLEDVLRLIRTPGIGPATFFTLLRRFGTAAEALARLPELAKNGGRKTPLIAASLESVQQEIEQTHAFGARFLCYGAEDYPDLLLTVSDAPPVLTLLGNESLWKKPVLAIVGARNASAGGCQLAFSFARELGAAGYSIASGLARAAASSSSRLVQRGCATSSDSVSQTCVTWMKSFSGS